MAPQKGGDIPVKSGKSLENGWKVLERRTNQDQPMGMEDGKGSCHNICAEGSCKK